VAVTDDGETTGEILVVQHDDRRWWPVAVSVGTSVLSAILAAALCLTINARSRAELERVQREQHDSLCAMIVALDDNYRDSPPGTELGRENAKALGVLRAAEHCPAPAKE
jgi:hypothetical protein